MHVSPVSITTQGSPSIERSGINLVGGEAPPHDPAEAEAPGRVDSPRRQQTRRSLIFTQAAINAEADKAGAAGNSDLMAKLKAAATNKKIQGAFMDVKNNGVSAAMKYKDDAE